MFDQEIRTNDWDGHSSYFFPYQRGNRQAMGRKSAGSIARFQPKHLRACRYRSTELNVRSSTRCSDQISWHFSASLNGRLVLFDNHKISSLLRRPTISVIESKWPTGTRQSFQLILANFPIPQAWKSGNGKAGENLLKSTHSIALGIPISKRSSYAPRL